MRRLNVSPLTVVLWYVVFIITWIMAGMDIYSKLATKQVAVEKKGLNSIDSLQFTVTLELSCVGDVGDLQNLIKALRKKRPLFATLFSRKKNLVIVKVPAPSVPVLNATPDSEETNGMTSLCFVN